MVNKSKLVRIAIITLFLFSLAVGLVAAQYTTEQTTNVTIGSDGTFAATQSDVGVSYQINGTAGATGTVTADLFNGNPQPTATTPSGISLTSFIAIAFNMNSNDFTNAIITITYTDSDVQNINAPYTVYKYDSANDSYIPLPSTVDTNAKTITVTLNSITDPLLAIGGVTKTGNSGGSGITWILVAVSVVLIVLAVVVIVKMMRPKSKSEFEKNYRGNDDDLPPPKTKGATSNQDEDYPPPKTKYPTSTLYDDLLQPKTKYPTNTLDEDLPPPKTKGATSNQDEDYPPPPRKRRAR